MELSGKDLKRRFFRKKGSGGSSSSSSSRTQQSLESPTHATPMLSMSPSLENAFLAGRSRMLGLPHGSRAPGFSARAHSGYPMSLDESEQKMKRNPTFSAAPRRARSAERFEGKRVTCMTSPAEAFVHQQQSRDELLSQYQYSRTPQPVRSDSYPVSETVRENQAIMARAKALAAAGSAGNIQSPPPTYTAAVHQPLKGPPSYHQAMAAMTMATAARAQKVAKPSQAYYVALAKAREARGLDTTTCGMSNRSIRAPVNFPAFTDDVICTCYNCRIRDQEQRDYNGDAVYMETQPFLTQQIMSNGMEFCPIT